MFDKQVSDTIGDPYGLSPPSMRCVKASKNALSAL